MEITQEAFKKMKKRYVDLLKSTKRENIGALIAFLEKNDFFDAPSSMHYHSAFKHGLLLHSLNVYDQLCELCKIYNKDDEINEDTIIISSLLHDICKTSFYKTEMRNKKINGVWKEVQAYTIHDVFPAGHGEKSVMIAQQFIKLSMQEILAINWHMGAFDIRCGDYQGKTALSNSMERFKLVTLLNMADVAATYLMEERED